LYQAKIAIAIMNTPKNKTPVNNGLAPRQLSGRMLR